MYNDKKVPVVRNCYHCSHVDSIEHISKSWNYKL